MRRVPLLEAGKVTGVVSLDDLVLELGVQHWNVAETAGSEIRESARSARGRRVTTPSKTCATACTTRDASCGGAWSAS